MKKYTIDYLCKIKEIKREIDKPDFIIWYNDNNIIIFGSCILDEFDVIYAICHKFKLDYNQVKENVLVECLGQ